jgi:hypothetical protein
MADKTQGIDQVREAYDASQAALAALTEEFRQFRTSVAFKEVGLTPKHAELYLAANPEGDATVDSVQAFADEYGLSAPAAPVTPAPPGMPEDGAPPAVERTLGQGPVASPADESLAGISGAAGTPQATVATALPSQMSKSDFTDLLKSNPQAAAQAYAEGRAPRNQGNVQADHLQKKGIIR